LAPAPVAEALSLSLTARGVTSRAWPGRRTDAVNQAKRLGIAPGNPVYENMEGYPTRGINTPAVLAFLSGWTAKLHAAGYISGVYSSSSSGVSDLVHKYGTAYREPDDIWFRELD
jgi:hypothetical protein